MKKLLYMSVFALILIGTTAFAYSEPSNWAKPEIEQAWNNDLAVQTATKNYQAKITREEFCRLMVNLYEKLTGTTAPMSKNIFSDVDYDNCETDILKAHYLGIVSGISENEFAPERYITRQEICIMLKRCMRAADRFDYSQKYDDVDFSDSDNISSWARSSVNYAYHTGIIKGVGENRINPKGNITCEEAIIMIYRIYKANAEVKEIDKADIVSFEDKGFEICVRNKLDNTSVYFGSLTKDILEEVTDLDLYNPSEEIPVKSLKDITKLPNLTSLDISYETDIKDFSYIAQIEEWESLYLPMVKIEDDSFLDKISVSRIIEFPNLPYCSEVNEFTDGKVFDDALIINKYTYSDALEMYKKIKLELEYISNNLISDNMSKYEKYKVLHDYLGLKMTYDMDKCNFLDEKIDSYAFQPAPHYLGEALVKGKGICDDYSTNYASLCSYFGLECYKISGAADGIGGWGSHAWNLIKIDDNYYHVDVTWDDPDYEDDPSYMRYKYFAISDDEMHEDHVWDMNEVMEKAFNVQVEEDLSDEEIIWEWTYYDSKVIRGFPECPESYNANY